MEFMENKSADNLRWTFSRTEMEVEFRLIESSLRELANELAVIRTSQQKLEERKEIGSVTITSDGLQFPKKSSEQTQVKPLNSACKFVPVVVCKVPSWAIRRIMTVMATLECISRIGAQDVQKRSKSSLRNGREILQVCSVLCRG